MRYYETVVGGERFFFVQKPPENAELSGGLPKRAILFSPGLSEDYRLFPTDKESGLSPFARADLLRAFSAFLSLCRGYPEREVSVTLEGSTHTLALPAFPPAFWQSVAVFPRSLGENNVVFPDGHLLPTAAFGAGERVHLFFADRPACVALSAIRSRILDRNDGVVCAVSRIPDPSGAFPIFCDRKVTDSPTSVFSSAALFLKKSGKTAQYGEVLLRCGKVDALCKILRTGGVTAGLRCSGFSLVERTPVGLS